MKYLIIFAIIIVAWCPWFKKEEAMRLVETKVNTIRASNSDLRPMNIDRSSIRKVPLGYTVQVSYDCTENDPVYGVTKSTEIVFVAFTKQVLGVPARHVRRSL